MLLRRALLASIIAFILIAGCGDDGRVRDGGVDAASDGGDASGDGAMTDAPVPPAPPAEAAPPVLGPCPVGFRSFVNDDGLELCDPWPVRGQADCPAGQAHFPGTPGCANVGTTCPADGLPAEVPGAGRTWWVFAGSFGVGTREDPMSSLAEAIAAASAGDEIAVGRGLYAERAVIPRGVTLRGACVTEVTIYGPDPGRQPVLTAGGDGVTVSNLTVQGSDAATGVMVGAGGNLTLEDVVIDYILAGGVTVEGGGRLTVRRTVIGGLIGLDGRAPGITARTGAVVDGEELTIDGAILAGLFVGGAGTSINLRRVAITGTAQGAAPGVGVVVSGGAEVELSESAIEGNFGAGGLVSGAGTRFVLEDSVIRGNLPDSTGRFGRGLNMETGAAGELRRCLVSANRDVGLYVNAGATLLLEDSVVTETASEMLDRRGGHGIEVQGAATVTASRVLLEGNGQTGALVSEGSTLIASDLVVANTHGQLIDGDFGIGLQIERNATAELDRIRLSDNRYLGMTVFSAGPVGIRDLTVERTASNPAGLYGRGLDVEDGVATVERALLVENHDMGLFASLDSRLDLTDLTIRDTQPESGRRTGGRGMNYQQGAAGSITRALVENSYEVGIGLAAGAGLVTGTDIVVRGVLPQMCAMTTCPGQDFGMGVLVANSPMTMTRFVVEDAALCGVQIAETGELDLDQGTVRGNLIGACVQVDGYGLDRLTTGVRFVDNGTSLESTSLPVPPPPSGVDL